MNIAFVIDTSHSMGQRTSQGVSFLDCAKAGVDHTIKTRQRLVYENSTEKYHLIVTDTQYPVRSTWEHDLCHFTKSLTTIKRVPQNLSLNQTIGLAFKHLNMFRHASSTDTYGHGRATSKVEPGAVVVYTDSQCEKLKPEEWRAPDSSEYTTGAWRYDQRLYVINLQAENYQVKDLKRIMEIAEFTGGNFYTCVSFRHMLNITEKICGNLNEYVVTARLECDEKAIPLILLLDKRTRTNFWPIPEEFTHFAHSLPARTSNPIFYYKQTQVYSSFKFPTDFPYDFYGIISTRKFEEQFTVNFPSRPSYIPVFMKEHSHPFGIIALEETGTKFLALCYNFLELWDCLEFYRSPSAMKSERSRNYEEKLISYLRELPVYYHYPLTKAIKSMKLFLPSSFKFPSPISLSPEVTLKLKSLKELEFSAKIEMDRQSKVISEQHHSEMTSCCQSQKYNLYCDIYTIPRDHLQASISLMNSQFFGDAFTHEIPISRMGDYISFASKLQVLRNAYVEPGQEKVNPINFGNPFRGMSAQNMRDNIIIADDPNISLPTVAKTQPAQTKVELVSIPVKRCKGFEAQLNTSNFCKRNSKCKGYLVLIEVIAYLRQRTPTADDKLINLLRTTVNKIFKKKSSNKINSYTEGKIYLLDAVIKQVVSYNKKHLLPQIETLKNNLLTNSV